MAEPELLVPDPNGRDTLPFQRTEVDKLKAIVTRYFRVYDTRWNEKTVAFHFNLSGADFEEKFDELRLRLKKDGFIPRVAKEKGEHVIYIIQSPRMKKRNIWVNIVLIILTLFTTTWAGALLWYSRINVGETSNELLILFEPLVNPECLFFGFLSFALPLMIILGTHETAHYLAAKKHNIDASLPYFIPLPPPMILGTMGAFISMREPISNKKALLDIGAAGPIAGFLVSIPIVIIGFTLEIMDPVPISDLPSSVWIFNEPLLFAAIRALFPSTENGLMHPTAFAGWVGLFVTALNLIPGGQLDGGHIARALLGKYARYLSVFVVIVLFTLTFVTQYMLWIFFAIIIILLGTSHPPPLDDISPLGNKRKVIGAFCMILLLLCIHYMPISQLTIPDYSLEYECENCDQVVFLGGTALYSIHVTNTADADGLAKFEIQTYSNNSNIGDWTTKFELLYGKGKNTTEEKEFKLKSKKSFVILLSATPNQNVKYGERITHKLFVNMTGLRRYKSNFTITTLVGTFDITTNNPEAEEVPDDIKKFDISVKNLLTNPDTIKLNYSFLTVPANTDKGDWAINITDPSVQVGPLEIINTTLYISTPMNAIPGTRLVIELVGHSQLNPEVYDSIKITLTVIRRDD